MQVYAPRYLKSPLGQINGKNCYIEDFKNDLLISAPPYDENKNSTLPNDNVENFSF